MAKLPIHILEAVMDLPDDLESPLIHIYVELKDNPSVSDELKQALWKEVVRSTPKRLTDAIRNSIIYNEYLDVQQNGGLPLKKGGGGWYGMVADRFHLTESGVEDIVRKLKNKV